MRQFYSDIHLWLHTTSSANLHVNTGHLSVYLVVFRLVLEDVDEGEDEDGRHVNRERDEEHEKITVVATTDAVVHPGAVMVKDLENKRNETLGSLKSQLSSSKIISNTVSFLCVNSHSCAT